MGYNADTGRWDNNAGYWGPGGHVVPDTHGVTINRPTPGSQRPGDQWGQYAPQGQPAYPKPSQPFMAGQTQGQAYQPPSIGYTVPHAPQGVTISAQDVANNPVLAARYGSYVGPRPSSPPTPPPAPTIPQTPTVVHGPTVNHPTLPTVPTGGTHTVQRPAPRGRYTR